MVSARLSNLLTRLHLAVGRGCVVSKTTDIRWLTGFTGSSSALLLCHGHVHFFTDGRYQNQAETEVRGHSNTDHSKEPFLDFHIVSGDPVTAAVQFAHSIGLTSLALQLDHLTYQQVTDIQKTAKTSHLKVDISLLRAVKDDVEVSYIKRALSITEATIKAVLHHIKPGITERKLAAEIDYQQRKLGAEKNSFETIVAFGAHSALPHARPGDTALEWGMPILLDFGAVVHGYASDMTRMIHCGPPSSEFETIYAKVEGALMAAQTAAKANLTGQKLDLVARDYLKDAKLDAYFSHSLGHGVGLEIHEWPSISSRNADPLPEGAVVTLEPGVYLTNQFGIRIENMVQLQESHCTVLNQLSTDLIVL